MLVPLGSQQIEAFEKNETERIEYFSESHKLPSKKILKKVEGAKLAPIHLGTTFSLPQDDFQSILLIQKIYLFHSCLLI